MYRNNYKHTTKPRFMECQKQTIVPYEQLKEPQLGIYEGCPIEQQLALSSIYAANGESWHDFEAPCYNPQR